VGDRVASEEIIQISPKNHKDTPPDPDHGQTNSDHICISYLLKMDFNIIFRDAASLPSGIVWVVQICTQSFFLACVLHVAPSHPPSFDHPFNTQLSLQIIQFSLEVFQ
jgi:hypothetical protein